MRKLLSLLLCLTLLRCTGCAAAEIPDTFLRLTGEPLPSLPAEVWTSSGMTPLPDAWQENGMKPPPDADWHDATPPTLNGTGWRIIKDNQTCQTLLVTQEGAYVLGMSFGGWGVTSAVPCDADDNGTPDLLFTYSWGSGIHRSHLAVLNLTTQELTDLAIWYEWESDLVVLPPTCRTESPLSSYAIAEYPVWLAELDVTGSFSYAAPFSAPTRSIGSVTIDHGLSLRLTEMENLLILD
ncbi:MAG: hypothetical protein IJE07_12670 [Clostridia bacterium]|nr:hypothetical protein [Clostridia bacterium]